MSEAAAIREGHVIVTSGKNCRGARLMVNKTEQSFGSEIVLPLNQEHEVEVHREGYVSFVEKFTLTESEPTKELTANLTLQKFELVLTCDIEDVDIKVNSQPYSPNKQYNYNTVVTISASKEGYKKYSKAITITENTTHKILLEQDIAEERSITVTCSEADAIIAINGTPTNKILERNAKGPTIHVKVTKDHYNTFEQQVPITEELYTNGFHVELEQTVYEVQFITVPSDAVIGHDILNPSNAKVFSDKILRGVYGTEFNLTINDRETRYLAKHMPYTITGNAQERIELELLQTYIVVNGGGKLRGALIEVVINGSRYVAEEGQEIRFPYDANWSVKVSAEGYETFYKEGHTFDLPVKVDVPNWEAHLVSVHYPEGCDPTKVELTIITPNGVTKKTSAFIGQVKVHKGSTVFVTFEGRRITNTYVSEHIVVDDDLTIEIPKEQLEYIIEKEPDIELIVESVFLWSPNPGVHQAHRFINDEEIPKNSTSLRFPRGTEIRLRCAYPGYEPYEETFTLNEPRRLEYKYLHDRMKIIEHTITVTCEPSDARIYMKRFQKELKSGDTFSTHPNNYDVFEFSKEGYKPVSERLVFSERHRDFHITLEELPPPPPEKPQALKNTLTPEEKFKWFDDIYPLFVKRNLYKHLRIGRILKVYGVTEIGCEKFYKHFARFLSSAIDYEIYNKLREYYDGPAN